MDEKPIKVAMRPDAIKLYNDFMKIAKLTDDVKAELDKNFNVIFDKHLGDGEKLKNVFLVLENEIFEIFVMKISYNPQ